ncbi:MAG: alpha-L-arabinofuranosidase [Chitinophagaceae bacterium]|nr:alpha-L-arabinofuranosidase [Chitinophagaceae bacterium]
MRPCRFLLTGLFIIVFIFFSFSQSKNNVITIKADKPYAAIQSSMWGVFFEDINLGADGGIYAEMVKNRSFEFIKPLMGWKVEQKPFVEGAVTILNRPDNKSNPRFARIKITNAAAGSLSITNEGFRGMGVKKDLRYDFSVMCRQSSAGVKLHIELLSAKDAVIGMAVMTPAATGNDWKKEAVSFHSSETEPKAKLRIWFEGTGVIDLDMISLFPEDTWKKRPGGMRADMVQLLADLKPGFIRFPGGCIVEGMDLSNRYQWKKTIGPVEERQLMINRWNVEFPARSTPDYFQTFGLGFFEYFQLAEDIGAEPLPILNCGMACQFNTAELVPLEQLDPYVQDALDLIEFANGDVNTKWGKMRADMGHPAPFNLKMMGVGNENWGPQYLERLAVFQKAIKEKYTDFKLVTSSGTDPGGERFDLLNGELRKMKVDIIDEHYYRKPEWFLGNVSRYDSYDRNGPKIFAGEYAGHSASAATGINRSTVQAAIAEAAFLTGLERNADVVIMASYAPLFAHIDGWQWAPDLIWVDNLKSVGTVSYHVQKLYSNNKGTHVVPALLNDKPVAGQDSLYASAVLDKHTGEIIIKIVNTSLSSRTATLSVEGIKKFSSRGTMTVLSGQPDAINTLDTPFTVSPVVTTMNAKGRKLDVTVKPFSLLVIRLGIK